MQKCKEIFIKNYQHTHTHTYTHTHKHKTHTHTTHNTHTHTYIRKIAISDIIHAYYIPHNLYTLHKYNTLAKQAKTFSCKKLGVTCMSPRCTVATPIPWSRLIHLLGADPGFSLGGGGAQEIMCAHEHHEREAWSSLRRAIWALF